MTVVEIPEGVVWPPPARPIVCPSAVATQQVFNGRGLLMGYSVNGGAAAGTFSLYDGADTSGQLVGSVDVAIDGSAWPWFGDHGIYLERGLTVDVTAALGGLTVFVASLWRAGV